MSPRDGHLRILPRDLVAYAVLLAAILGQWYSLNAKIELVMAVQQESKADRQRIWDVLLKRAEASEVRPEGDKPRR